MLSVSWSISLFHFDLENKCMRVLIIERRRVTCGTRALSALIGLPVALAVTSLNAETTP